MSNYQPPREGELVFPRDDACLTSRYQALSFNFLYVYVTTVEEEIIHEFGRGHERDRIKEEMT